uniref:Uncharacterized protein n=1 Tax=Solanum tuberosum TaxID=4113 RepID=M1AQX2_SOLTU
MSLSIPLKNCPGLSVKSSAYTIELRGFEIRQLPKCQVILPLYSLFMVLCAWFRLQ